MIRVLQTRALPLGHVAIQEVICLIKKRAGSETRTRDLLLGKEVFYQLNYTRALFLFVDFKFSCSSTLTIIQPSIILSSEFKKFVIINFQPKFPAFNS